MLDVPGSSEDTVEREVVVAELVPGGGYPSEEVLGPGGESVSVVAELSERVDDIVD